jgi:histidine triad (HIT) family protein
VDCIFCKIAAGQIPAKIVYEDPHVVAFRDIKPEARVHVLVIPRKHVERVSALTTDADFEIVGHIHRAANKIAEKEGLLSGFRLVTNSGPDAGQTVDHLHYHLLGGRRMTWPPG